VIFGSLASFAALVYVVMAWSDRRREAAAQPTNPAEVALAGLALVLLSLLPFWVTGFAIYQKNQLWSERLALAAMPGASMLVVGAVTLFATRPAHATLLLSVLMGLAVSLQVQTARAFQTSWDKQRQFYWQLSWRAPSLRSGTMLVADQEILFFMGIYPTAFAINTLYPQHTAPPQASYWFNAGFEHMNFDRFAAGAPDTFQKYSTSFQAESRHVVAITFEPGSGQCLWVLGPELANAGGLRPAAETWLSISHVDQIASGPAQVPPRAIFGPEPQRSWCYFFERADLARQYGDWNAVQELWDQAGAAGMRAANGVELVPFIEAFARQGKWPEAQAVTRQAQALPDRSTSLFCDVWRDLDLSSEQGAAKVLAVLQIQEDLGCQPWQSVP